MFYYIEGTVAEIEPNLVVLDCSGVGYALNATANTISYLSRGGRSKLYVSEVVKEDAFDLYGFSSKTEKHFFEMLISVSGIGPKAALSILSANTPEGLALAVSSGNEKALTVAPGIGKKIAQRVILELKDKIGKESAAEGESFAAAVVPVSDNSAVGDAVAALTVLGYNSNEIAQTLKTIDISGMNTEQIIKTVLRRMVK
ncbi:MAG: Holliday junction branch migration protein RuvA [Oscillospiraceae bacterium]|nr:Holliday junction branch migration protein RuvA [Oscillospiraceae bacterium]